MSIMPLEASPTFRTDFYIPTISNNMADLRDFELGATLALFNAQIRTYVPFTKYTAFRRI
jgi:hypothetical protein